MHSPAATPRPSLYFDYTVHPAWLPGDHPGPQQHRVVISGAGPAGLVTALTLAQHGVPCVVLSAELQVSEGSRAIVFTRRTMEILQQVGVAERVSESGLPWRFGNSYYRGERVFRMEGPHGEDDRFWPMTNLQQQFLEQYLLDACAMQPGIEVRWGNKLVGMQQDEQGVTVQVDTPGGEYALRSEWLVAADGGRSLLRSVLGLRMEGAAYENSFVIADIHVDLPFPTERRAYFDPPWNPGNTILMHREPHGIWRVDYQLPPGETPEQALAPGSMKQRIDAQLAMVGHAGAKWEMDWCSVYSARALTLPDYRQGRVLFAGDAAHLLPIFGVRGANTAFQDAQALGWQLALVARGIASPALLRNYSHERVGAAREIIEEAGKSTRFMAPPSRGFLLLRNAVLSLSLTQEFVRPLYHWRTARAHAYAQSVLNARDDDDAQFSAGPGHGAPPQNVRLAQNGFLLDHLGPTFTLLCAAPGGSLPDGVHEVVRRRRAGGVPLHVLAVGAGEVIDVDRSLPDSDGRVRARYGLRQPGAAVLFRPDQHVCARWLRLDAARLDRALDQALQKDSHA